MERRFIAKGSEGSQKEASFSAADFFDISIPISSNKEQVDAFHIPSAEFSPLKIGEFVGKPFLKIRIRDNCAGDTRQGGSVNCEIIKFCPHGNGTHTECIGHVTKERISITQLIKKQTNFIPSILVTVTPEKISESGDIYPAQHSPDDLV